MHRPNTGYYFIKNGFSLIELLIVLAMVAILLSLAYPSYNHYLEKARRIDGQSALMDLANRMEHYYSEHNSYASATIDKDPNSDVLPSAASLGQWYDLSIITQDETSFALQATPLNAQSTDIMCQSLTLNHLGEKGIADGPMGTPTGNSTLCW